MFDSTIVPILTYGCDFLFYFFGDLAIVEFFSYRLSYVYIKCKEENPAVW